MIDTNVLIYRAIPGPEEHEKARRAGQVMQDSDFCLSVQVLQEFYVQATRPTRLNALTHEMAVRFIEPLLERPIQTTTPAIFGAALATKARFQISYWDAAIIEAARALGCSAVLSEDLGDGEDYDGVWVRNPFAGL